MKVRTFKIIWTGSFTTPKLIDDWKFVTFESLNIISSEDMEYRWDDNDDILTLKANTPLTIGWKAGSWFPFQIRNWGTIQIMVR